MLVTDELDLCLGGRDGPLRMDLAVGVTGALRSSRTNDSIYCIISSKVVIKPDTNTANSTLGIRVAWTEEFEHDGREDVHPGEMLYAPSGVNGDVLLLSGTTAGRWSAFGTTGGGAAATDAKPGDLDWSLLKTWANEEEFVGHGTFDDNEMNCFVQTHSKHIRSNPGWNCPAAEGTGPQEEIMHAYFVRNTAGVLQEIRCTK